jgi:hypothetical protein
MKFIENYLKEEVRNILKKYEGQEHVGLQVNSIIPAWIDLNDDEDDYFVAFTSTLRDCCYDPGLSLDCIYVVDKSSRNELIEKIELDGNGGLLKS